ncbi:MAG: MFS transporter [Propionibacteriaceae bacterium]|nr:MFS transporter [Propionibacteriaceae bacterium]
MMNPIAKFWKWCVSQVANSNAALLVLILCWLLVVFDGYDLTVFGASAPKLPHTWGLTPSITGTLGSMAFIGMLIGAIFAGGLADLIGRRKTVILCLSWFSVMTALCAVSPNLYFFGAFRLLGGLGLGGMIPTASALSGEYSDQKRRPLVSVIIMSGVPIGGIVATALGIPVLGHASDNWGWRLMFLFALVGVIIVLPLAAALLPESAVWLRGAGKTDRARELETRYHVVPDPDHEHTSSGPRVSFVGRFARLLSKPFALVTILFVVATVGTLFAWFGLATWLPSLMRSSGIALGTALFFTLVLYVGAMAGALIMGFIGTKIGSLWAGAVTSLIGAIGLFILVMNPPNADNPPSMVLVYAALVMAGIGTHGTQCLLISACSNHYPHMLRGTALGLMLGVGRIGAVLAPMVGGFLQAGAPDAATGVTYNYIAFGLGVSVACILLVILIPVAKNSLAARVSQQAAAVNQGV